MSTKSPRPHRLFRHVTFTTSVVASCAILVACSASDTGNGNSSPGSGGAGGINGAGGAQAGGAGASGAQAGGASGHGGAAGVGGATAGNGGNAGEGGAAAGNSGSAGVGGGTAGNGGDTAGSAGATAGAAGASGGDSGAGGDAGSAGASNQCGPDTCYIDGSCVEAGQPKSDDPCQACIPTVDDDSWTADSANVACKTTPAWAGVSQGIAVTPYGHETAISCHNCYTSKLNSTMTKISQAKAENADLIELDVSDESGTIYVHHDDGTSSGPTLTSVLSNSVLKTGDQMLFIEIKETTPTEAFISDLLQQLDTNGYATASRPVYLRAFHSRLQSLLLARKLLATSAFASMRDHVRLHVLFPASEGNDIAALQGKIKAVRDDGMHGVEFDYHTKNLLGAVAYAKSLNLETSLWTLPAQFGEVFVAAFRDEVDSLTVEYPIAKSRQIVQNNNGLAYINVWNQPSNGSSVTWYGTSSNDKHTATVNTSTTPSLLVESVGEDRFGTSLQFKASSKQSLPLYDGDNQPSHGYLVAVYVNFDKVDIPDGATQGIFNKSNSASFALELNNPNGSSVGTRLRFCVYVSGGYRCAYSNMSDFANGTDGYFIIGAYDGNDSVRMWIDGSAEHVTNTSSYTGGVKRNDVPMILGADPEVGPSRFFFDGIIQMAVTQDWATH